jgi:hypothetical protein
MLKIKIPFIQGISNATKGFEERFSASDIDILVSAKSGSETVLYDRVGDCQKIHPAC